MKTVNLIDENLTGQPGLSPFIDPDVSWRRNQENTECDINIYTDQLCTRLVNESKINCAWIIEPSIVNGENYTYIVNNYSKFKYVFSYMKYLNDRIPNHVQIFHGGTWLKSEDIGIWSKNKNISFIFSDKQWNSYHRLRHRLYDAIKNNSNVSFYGAGCNNKIEFKSQALKDYRFSIIIENSEERDYFTEKIIDCFLTGTIPVYIGCPAIDDYFNSDGLIRVNDIEPIINLIDNLTPELYESKKHAIQENFEIAKKYIHPEQTINQFLIQNELI